MTRKHLRNVLGWAVALPVLWAALMLLQDVVPDADVTAFEETATVTPMPTSQLDFQY